MEPSSEPEVGQNVVANHGTDPAESNAQPMSIANGAGMLATLGARASGVRFGVPVLLLVALSTIGASFFVCWWQFLPKTIEWLNKEPWRWAFGWLAVLFLAFGPGYVIVGAATAITAALKATGDKKQERAFDELDELEREIRQSKAPVDYARYGRKALEAYYYMGQNQVRVSFFIGVAAMVFGFLFLLVGLLAQIVEVGHIPYLRAEPKIETVTIGGGLIIEFVAGTFLWIYRAAIVQLNLYYQQQLLVHSALISMAISEGMPSGKQEALRAIVDRMLTSRAEPHSTKRVKRRSSAVSQHGIEGQSGSTVARSSSEQPDSGLQQASPAISHVDAHSR